jgi:hypothetical protein
MVADKPKVKQQSIYVLIDPRDGRARYLGVTVRPSKRRWEHIAEAKAGGMGLKNTWIREILEVNDEPLLAVLWTMESEKAKLKEKLLIKGYSESGWMLTNTLGMPVTKLPEPTPEVPFWKKYAKKETFLLGLGQIARMRGRIYGPGHAS